MSFRQPDAYEESLNESNFEKKIKRDDHKTVVNKYKEFNKYIQKTRPDAEFVEDGN